MTTDPARFIGLGIIALIGGGGCLTVGIQALVKGSIRIGRHSDEFSAAVDGGLFWWVVGVEFVVGFVLSFLAVYCFRKVFGGNDADKPPMP